MNKQLQKAIITASVITATGFSLLTFCQKAHESKVCESKLSAKPIAAAFQQNESEMMARVNNFEAWRNSCLHQLISLENRLRSFARMRSSFDSLYNAKVTLQASDSLDSVHGILKTMDRANLGRFKQLQKDVVAKLGDKHPFSQDICSLVSHAENPYGKPTSALIREVGKLRTELYGVVCP